MRQKEQRACSQIESNKKRIIIACKDRGMIKESGDAGTIARAAADCLLSATALDSEKNNCAQWTWQVTDLEMSELYCKLDPLEHCIQKKDIAPWCLPLGSKNFKTWSWRFRSVRLGFWKTAIKQTRGGSDWETDTVGKSHPALSCMYCKRGHNL